MKKTIVFGSLLACFLMLMIPTVSAVEYQTVVDANESYLINEIQNKKLDIQTFSNKIKDINIREIREELHNINIHEFREKILRELDNSDLTEEQKAYVSELLGSELLLTILIRGFIIPVVLYTISFVGAEVLPQLAGFLLSTVIAIAVPELYLLPVEDMIEEETGSFLLGAIAYFILLFIDIGLAQRLTMIIIP